MALTQSFIDKINSGNTGSIDKIIRDLINSPYTQQANQIDDYYEGNHFWYSNAPQMGKNQNRGVYYGDVFVYTRSKKYLYKKSVEEARFEIKCNYSKLVVDTIADACCGITNEDIGFAFEETKKSDENKLLDFYSENSIEKLANEVFEDMSKHGFAVLRLRPRDNTEYYDTDYLLETERLSTFHPILDISNNMIGAVIAFFVNSEIAKDSFDVNLTKKYNDIAYAEVWLPDQVATILDGKITTEDNPFGFVPFFKFKANKREISDLLNILDLQDEINKTLSDNSIKEMFSAFPLLTPKELIPPDVFSQYREIGFNISPRSLVTLPVEQLAGEGIPMSSLENLKQLVEKIAITSNIPLSIWSGEGSANESGVARRMRMGSLVRKANKMRMYFEEAFDLMNKKILKIL